MYNIILIGDTGYGKSVLAKKLIGDRNCFVYDVNNEYQDLSLDKKKQRCRAIPDIDYDHINFMNDAGKRKNTMILFEEATGFCMANTSKLLRALIANKRHTGNNYIFIFHTINSVPDFILSLYSFIYLFKTEDNYTKVLQKERPKITEAFEKMQMLTHEQCWNKGKYIKITK